MEKSTKSQLTPTIKITKNERRTNNDSKNGREVTLRFLGNILITEKQCMRRMIAQNLFKVKTNISSHWIRKKVIAWFYAW